MLSNLFNRFLISDCAVEIGGCERRLSDAIKKTTRCLGEREKIMQAEYYGTNVENIFFDAALSHSRAPDIKPFSFPSAPIR